MWPIIDHDTLLWWLWLRPLLSSMKTAVEVKPARLGAIGVGDGRVCDIHSQVEEIDYVEAGAC